MDRLRLDRQWLDDANQQLRSAQLTELETSRRLLERQLHELQTVTAAAQARRARIYFPRMWHGGLTCLSDQQEKNRECQATIRALGQERRVLETELVEAIQLNQSLRIRADKERQSTARMTVSTRKRTAQDLEERADTILQELDTFAV